MKKLFTSKNIKKTKIVRSKSEYWQRKGLKQPPFTVFDLDKDFYASQEWEQTLDLLHHSVRYSNVLLSIVGSKESGKTTLLHHFIQQAKEFMQVQSITGDQHLTKSDMSRLLAKSFNAKFSFKEKQSIEEQVAEQLVNLQYLPKTSLLCVDDAHLLSREIIQFLLDLLIQQSETQMGLHILFFAEPTIESIFQTLIRKDNVYQSIIHSIYLSPLDQKQTESYIRHRFKQMNLREYVDFPKHLFKKISRRAQGLPGRVDYYTQQALEQLVKQSEKPPFIKFIHQRKNTIVGALFFLLGFLIAYDLLLTSERSVSTHPTQQKIIQISLSQNKMNKPEISTQVFLARESTHSPLHIKHNTQVKKHEQAHPQNFRPAVNHAKKQKKAKKLLSIGQQIITYFLKGKDNIKVPYRYRTTLPISQQISKINLRTATQKATVAIKPQAGSHTHTIHKVTHPQTRTARVGVAPPRIIHNQTRSHIVHHQVPAQYHTRSENHLLELPSTHYVLQLMGLHDKAKLQRAMVKAGLAGKVLIFHTYFHENDWYVAIYKHHYKTSKEAAQSIAKLPNSIKQLHPWVRSIAGVKRAIDKKS